MNSNLFSLHPNKCVTGSSFDVNFNTVLQIGKLNVYRNTTNPEELAGLHLADRLMVQLIKIDRLAPRIQGMLYKSKFEDTITLLEDGTRKLIEASDDLLHAAKFKELMNVSTIPSVLRLTAHLTSLVNFAYWQLHERYWTQRRCLWFQSQQYQQGRSARYSPCNGW